MKHTDEPQELSTRLHPRQIISYEYFRFKQWLSTPSSAQRTKVQTSKGSHLTGSDIAFTQATQSPPRIFRRQAPPPTASKPSTTTSAPSHSTPSALPHSASSSPSASATHNSTRSAHVSPAIGNPLPAHSSPAPSATTHSQTGGPPNGVQSIHPNTTTPTAGPAVGTQKPPPQPNAPNTPLPVNNNSTLTSSHLSSTRE